jgi:MinD superfamily P-loop ATPase
VCAWFCVEKAIEFAPVDHGEWFLSDTRHGPMVHARLGIAEENSGKLISLVRTEARKLAVKQNLDLVIIDGSPGIGCPVIASITGADQTLIVTEPTLSGLHDLQRVLRLTRHFGMKTLVCVNKWDLNADLCREIEMIAQQKGVEIVGRIRYDVAVTRAQIKRQALVEFTETGAAADVKKIWSRVSP